jgi:hypothetical protein
MAVPAGAFAQAKGVSDAQVEANVLKAFAGDQRLANQPINTSTVFGTVTLTGSVTNDAARDAAEQIASRTDGVKKVVDQLTVGAAPAQAAAANGADFDPASQNVLPSDGSALPAAQGQIIAQQNQQQADPNNGNQPPAQYQQQQQAPQYSQGQGYPQQQGGYPQQGQPAYGDPNAQAGNYPPPPPANGGRLYYRDYQRQQGQGGYPPQQGGQAYAAPQGQPGGAQVTIPQGAVLAVAINHWMSSGNAEPGSGFIAVVGQDVVAGGQIAIPRGATVEGTVVDAKGAGALKGKGELSLQLNTLILGGQRYPIQSDVFVVNGRDKTGQSVASTIIGAGMGALIGGAIGRGTGAAIGAGVGGAAGLGASAASGGGQANLPPEAMLHFRITAPLQVTTVSEPEMQRLGGYAGPANAYMQGPPPPGYGYVPHVGPPPVAVVVGGRYPYGYRRPYFWRGYYYY